MTDTQQPVVPPSNPPDGKAVPASAPASEGLTPLLHAIADRVEPVVKLITTIAERQLNAQEAKAKYNVRMAWVAVFIVTLVVLVSAGLTYSGQIDGSTFTFLLGLIVGYVLTFIRDAIQPQGEK